MDVLIIDDDEDDRVLLAEALNEIRSDVTCHTARDGEEALKFLRLKAYSKPEIIFLDLNMPKVNGVQCLRELKKDEQLQNIPVVVFTTSRLQKDKEQAREIGACHFLTKPSSFNEFRKMLTEIINNMVIIENKNTDSGPR